MHLVETSGSSFIVRSVSAGLRTESAVEPWPLSNRNQPLNEELLMTFIKHQFPFPPGRRNLLDNLHSVPHLLC